MKSETWFAKVMFVLILGIAGCGKHDGQAAATQSEMPAPAASASGGTEEKFYESEDLVKAALVMARNLTVVTALQGKFAGYGSIEAIAKRTDAQGNVHWKAFSSMLSGSMLGPYGYHTPLGDFVMVRAVTPDQEQIGLVINLDNKKTALYPIGAPEISPEGDNLASALVVVLEVEDKVKSTFATPDYTTTALRRGTIASLEQALAESGSVKSAAGTQGEVEVQSNATSKGTAYAEAIAAQKVAIREDLSARESKELGQARSDAMNKRVLELFYAVFEDAKKSGLKLNDPRDHIKSVNRGRRNSGVWELLSFLEVESLS